MSIKANGSSSGDNSQLAIKRVHHQAPEQGDNSMAVNLVTTDDEILDVQPLQLSIDMLEIKGPERSIKRLAPYFVLFSMVIYLMENANNFPC